MMPPTIVPAASARVELGAPFLILGTLFALTAWGLYRRTVPRTLGCISLALLGGVLALDSLFILSMLTVESTVVVDEGATA
jgi:hypothetical protein